MSKNESKGQFDHYKKWTTDEGYSFVAESKEDAILYLNMIILVDKEGKRIRKENKNV